MGASAATASDPYDVLGVSRDASAEDIKRAYRKLALKWHPDRNRQNQQAAELQFKKVSKAYSILSDPDQRSQFDRVGADIFEMERGERHMTDEEVAAAIFKQQFG